jgi:hypothetical protein
MTAAPAVPADVLANVRQRWRDRHRVEEHGVEQLDRVVGKLEVPLPRLLLGRVWGRQRAVGAAASQAGQQNAHRAFPQVGGAQSPARGMVARGGGYVRTDTCKERFRRSRWRARQEPQTGLNLKVLGFLGRQELGHYRTFWALAEVT